MLTVHHLTKSFDTQPLFENVTFSYDGNSSDPVLKGEDMNRRVIDLLNQARERGLGAISQYMIHHQKWKTRI